MSSWLLMGLPGVAYLTGLGGFLAASFTDLIQSIIMTVALVVVLGFGVTQAGGVAAVAENARSLTDYLSLVRIHDPATGGSNPYSLLTICSLLAWGLGYFGMPHILVRFMAIEEEKKLKLSRRVASSWVVISMAVAIVIGPVMLMALFWKRSNKWGALAGMVTGGVMVFVWKFLIAPLGGALAIYELLPAFLCALVMIVVVSLLTPAPDKAVVEVFEEVKG